MNYKEFLLEAERIQLRPPVEHFEEHYHTSLDNEALFQLPLLAMVILTLAKGPSKPQLIEIGQLVGECLERTVAGFKGSSQYIGWSANLRIRTIKALTFLEHLGFAEIINDGLAITATPAGRKILENVSSLDSPLTNSLLLIERSFQNIRVERRISTEVI